MKTRLLLAWMLAALLVAGLRAAETVHWKKLGNGFDIIGRLGVPLGTAVEIEATIVTAESASPRGMTNLWGQYLLRVEKVAGRPLPQPEIVVFRGSGLRVQLPATTFELYEWKTGTAPSELKDGQIAPFEKEYVGKKFKLLVFEEGAFEGFPSGVDVPLGISFIQKPIIPGLAPGESPRFRPMMWVLRVIDPPPPPSDWEVEAVSDTPAPPAKLAPQKKNKTPG